MSSNSQYTIENITEKSLPILKKYNVIRAGIFGSYAKGTFKKSSDIDILVEVPRGTGLIKFISLKFELEKTLQKKVDLGSYFGIKPQVEAEILATEIKIL